LGIQQSFLIDLKSYRQLPVISHPALVEAISPAAHCPLPTGTTEAFTASHGPAWFTYADFDLGNPISFC